MLADDYVHNLSIFKLFSQLIELTFSPKNGEGPPFQGGTSKHLSFSFNKVPGTIHQ